VPLLDAHFALFAGAFSFLGAALRFAGLRAARFFATGSSSESLSLSLEEFVYLGLAADARPFFLGGGLTGSSSELGLGLGLLRRRFGRLGRLELGQGHVVVAGGVGHGVRERQRGGQIENKGCCESRDPFF